MDNILVNKKQAQGLMKEILSDISKIRNESQKYCKLINEEYKESNLYFLKELLDMFGMDEKRNGIGSLAVQLESICGQVNDTLEEYFAEAGQE